MPNANAPFGLQADRNLLGNELRAKEYFIASGLAANIGLNSAVKSTGTNKRITPLTAAGDAIRGVFTGVRYTDTNGLPVFSKNWVAGTVTLNSADAVALIYDDPNILYRCAVSGAFGEANVGKNANLTADGSLNGMSTAAVDSTTFTTATATSVKVYDYVRNDINEVGPFAQVYVLLNVSELKSGTPAI